MKNELEIFFSDRTEFEHLVVRIEFERKVLVEINKEKGNDNLELTFDPNYFISERENDLILPLSEFLAVLNAAIEELKNCP